MKNPLFALLAGLFLALPGYTRSPFPGAVPMVGYSTMKEVLPWAQTTKPAKVKFIYWNLNKPGNKFSTCEVTIQKEHANVARLVADQLVPGQRDEYQLYINSQLVKRPYRLTFRSQPLWQYRTDSPPFKFVTGSCTFINETKYDRAGGPYRGEYEIFNGIYLRNADFMLSLGDNTYLREADWNSRVGIYHRYTHSCPTEEMQPALASMHHGAIWNDHDYGPNDPGSPFWNKDIITGVFKLFWGNPDYYVIGKGGIAGTFFWNDNQFLLLNDRYLRTPRYRQDSNEGTILGKDRFEWLIDALTFDRASFRFAAIGSLVLNTTRVGEDYANDPGGREKLIEAIINSKARGVIFLDGDPHYTALSVLKVPGYCPLYDLMFSPLTAGVYGPKNENNLLTPPEKRVIERNYWVLEVSGPRTDRALVINIKNKGGKLLWKKEIRATDFG